MKLLVSAYLILVCSFAMASSPTECPRLQSGSYQSNSLLSPFTTTVIIDTNSAGQLAIGSSKLSPDRMIVDGKVHVPQNSPEFGMIYTASCSNETIYLEGSSCTSDGCMPYRVQIKRDGNGLSITNGNFTNAYRKEN